MTPQEKKDRDAKATFAKSKCFLHSVPLGAPASGVGLCLMTKIRHETEHLLPLRPERDPDADLRGLLSDNVGENPNRLIAASSSEIEAKTGRRVTLETRVQCGLADHVIHGQNVGDGQIAIELLQHALDRQCQVRLHPNRRAIGASGSPALGFR